jgi:hypothetical protein
VGDFEYVEEFTKRKYNGKNLPVRVYTTRGLKEQGRFALQNAHQIVDYFSEVKTYIVPVEIVLMVLAQVFKVDYPLPKADLLAVHEFVRHVIALITLMNTKRLQLNSSHRELWRIGDLSLIVPPQFYSMKQAQTLDIRTA